MTWRFFSVIYPPDKPIECHSARSETGAQFLAPTRSTRSTGLGFPPGNLFKKWPLTAQGPIRVVADLEIKTPLSASVSPERASVAETSEM